jgi:glucokinase
LHLSAALANFSPPVKPTVAMGLDVGATRIKAVVVENDGTILDQIVRLTQPERWLEQVADLLHEVLPITGPILEIGVCAPGVANRSADSIRDCGRKIPGLEGMNWKRQFNWERPIPVMNDAQAALLGESWLGAAVGRRRRNPSGPFTTEAGSLGMAARRLPSGVGNRRPGRLGRRVWSGPAGHVYFI